MQILKVSGMSCGHCVRAITRVVQSADAAAEVQVDLDSAEVRVASQLSLEQLLAIIRDEGYGAEPA
ncbi:MAG: copper chaperone [Pseudomonas sp.]|nr:MAG: copper chaperone [Pseudomonas sp.]